MARSIQPSEEPRLQVRQLRTEDYDAVRELQEKKFKGIPSWSREQFESQVRIFPEGQLGIEFDNRLVAAASSLIIDGTELGSRHTFSAACDDGFIRNHDPEGDSLYGIDITIDPEFRGQRLSRRLYDARKELVRRHNLNYLLIAGRMPGYQRHADKLSATEYVRKVAARELRDPVVTHQLSNGFTIRAVLPDYFPLDKESKGNAVFMEWTNPYFVPAGDRRSSSDTVRVAAVQYEMREIGSFERFTQQCEFFIDTAGEYNCDFLLFPELLTNQLLALVQTEQPVLTARRLHEFTEGYVDFFTSMAVKYNINIIGGSHLTVEDDRLYNIAYLFRRDGSVGKQYKVHVTPSEARWWGVSPGKSFEVLDTDRGKVAIFVCYDIEFPELGRIATKRGANLFFVPFNTDIRPSYMRVRACAQARCIENGAYCVLSGAIGNLPFVDGADIHYAQSCILTPSDISFERDGVGAEATPNVEIMLVHDIDLALARRMRREGTVRTWVDRRTDIYRVNYQVDGESEAV